MFTEKDFDEFESAMAAKARAEARHLSSEATLRRGGCVALVLLGAGGLILLSGEGISLATGGMYAAQESEKTVAAILAQNREQNREDLRAMLAATTIQTRGTVTGEVSVKDGGTVRVSGTVSADMPRPSPELAELPAVAKAGIVTNYTVFKTVKFGAAEVQTGWMFKDGDQQRPSFQYCQYGQFTGNGTTQTNVDIGLNGHIALPTASPFPAVDLRAAYEAGCIWANDDAAPVAPSTSPATILTRAAKR
jgi:hypothetical protein